MTQAALINLGVCIAVAVAVYVTKSAYPLFALFFMVGFKSKETVAKCPNCQWTFKVGEEEDKD